MKLLGGFSAQQNGTPPAQSPPQTNGADSRTPQDFDAPRANSTQSTPQSAQPQDGQSPRHNVMADVIARHEQLAARARRK